MEELEFLTNILQKHPLDSLRKISKEERVDYYKLKRLYDKYYGKHVTVSAIYNPRKLGLKSYVTFLSVPSDSILEVAKKMSSNPYVSYLNPAFGFKNGLTAFMAVPKDQVNLIDEFLSRYSDDYEWYEMQPYSYSIDDSEDGGWKFSYDYAILMDILKEDARTPISEIANKLGKTGPTVRYMIERLKKEGVILAFEAVVDMTTHDRGVIGITRELKEEVIQKFQDYEMLIAVLPGHGYMIEWYFSSSEDLGLKVMEFSRYVDKLLIEYFDETFKKMNDERMKRRFRMIVKKDGSGYRSLLDFMG
ncbi:MAG: hypothetical protein PWQ79_142 [Thermococcaceae archaeon]|nr:hypothetical protein [Thermococcaceae archaeon]MDK2913227.1 hypothetical protein [Thermococcaceae archaeon]